MIEKKSSPVILVHGFEKSSAAGAGTWSSLDAAFRRWGWSGPLTPVGYYDRDPEGFRQIDPYGLTDAADPHAHHFGGDGEHVGPDQEAHNPDTDIRHLAYHLAWYIHDEWNARGRSVNVVAHSMGGLITRYAIHGVDQNDPEFPPVIYVDDIVTLGTPHAGTRMAAACTLKWDQCAQMRRRDSFIEDLQDFAYAPHATGGTDWTVVGSRDDLSLAPNETSIDFLGAAHRTIYRDGEGVGHTDLRRLDDRDSSASVACWDIAAHRKEQCATGDEGLRRWHNAPWPLRWAFLGLSSTKW